MGFGWSFLGRQQHGIFFAVLSLHLMINGCLSLNHEGMALLEFRSRVEVDPNGALDDWDPNDSNPCNWFGVHCMDGRVDVLNLKEQSLGGKLAPELGKLGHLRTLILCKNKFSGVIPKEIGGLTMLEHLDLRDNNFSGTIPMEIKEMASLNCFLLCSNKLENGLASCMQKPNKLSHMVEYDQNLSSHVSTEIGCTNRIEQSGFKSRSSSPHNIEERHGQNIPSIHESYVVQDVRVVTSVRRMLFEETSNLPAAHVSSVPPQVVVTVPSTGSGSFPAAPNGRKKTNNIPAPMMPASQPNKMGAAPPVQPEGVPIEPATSVDNSLSKKWRWWTYALIILGVALLLGASASMLSTCRSKGVATIRPWKTGLSGQLQKAFITGVPQVNRPEVEAACEDFSNIISTSSDYTVFKGTLSSGVEIAVASTAVASAKDWSKRSEVHFRKKIEMLARVNHKNFINLLGYCKENEPFMRMMVFEYAPNGTLYEHLHVKEFEHLDWGARMRIIMGTAYCLQYMHHELKPPLAHPDLQSSSILITDDYAAKIADMSIWKEVIAKGKISGDDDSEHSEVIYSDSGSNVYSFGILMLEIISGRVPYCEEQGSLLDWAMEYLNDRHSIGYLVDPALKSFKNEELDVICEAINDCIKDPKKRPTMKDIATKLREVIGISPEAAKPRLSPLWWAELEILSVEAS